MIEYDTRYWNNNLTTNNNNSMDFLGIGQAIGGIAGAIGTYAASKQNRKAQEATNAANLALARQQNDWNIQQWEREMDWNSPANKLKLLEDAGLNPVWYGANLGPTETQAPKSADLANQVAPQLDAGAIGSSLGNLTSSLIAAGQYHLTRRAQDLEERKIGIEERRLGIQSAETIQRIEESKKVVEKMNQEIDNLQKQGKLTEEQAKVAAKQVELMEDERLRYQEETNGLKLDNKQKQMYLDQYSEILAAELNIKVNEAKELAAAAYNYITSANRAEAEQYGIELENQLTEQYGAYDRVGGIVSKGVSIIGSIAGVAGKAYRFVKGVKTAGKVANAAEKMQNAKVETERSKARVNNAKAESLRRNGVNPSMRGRR